MKVCFKKCQKIQRVLLFRFSKKRKIKSFKNKKKFFQNIHNVLIVWRPLVSSNRKIGIMHFFNSLIMLQILQVKNRVRYTLHGHEKIIVLFNLEQRLNRTTSRSGRRTTLRFLLKTGLKWTSRQVGHPWSSCLARKASQKQINDNRI